MNQLTTSWYLFYLWNCFDGFKDFATLIMISSLIGISPNGGALSLSKVFHIYISNGGESLSTVTPFRSVSSWSGQKEDKTEQR